MRSGRHRQTAEDVFTRTHQDRQEEVRPINDATSRTRDTRCDTGCGATGVSGEPNWDHQGQPHPACQSLCDASLRVRLDERDRQASA
jgi:hypothetical protein